MSIAANADGTPVSPALAQTELALIAERLVSAGEAVHAPLQAGLIAGGRSNLTYRLTDGITTWVMRTPPRVGRTPSAHDVAREYRVTQALAATGVPVAPAPTPNGRSGGGAGSGS
jgi:aminoglycoside phosphotransferase (APT) family kinase protein